MKLRLVLMAALLFALPARADWSNTFMPQPTTSTQAPVFTYDFTAATDSTGADLSLCTQGVQARFDQSVLDSSTDAVVQLMACQKADSVWQSCTPLRRGPDAMPDGQNVGLGTVPADRPFLLVHVVTAPSSDTARVSLTCRTDAYTVTDGGLRAGLPSALRNRMDYLYPSLFMDFTDKSEVAATTFTAASTTGTPAYGTLWVALNSGSPSGNGVSNLFGGVAAINPGTVASTGMCFRKVGEYANFADGNASDSSLNASIFEARVAVLTAGSDVTYEIGVNSATSGAQLSTAGALGGTSSDAAVFLLTTDYAAGTVTTKFQTRRAGTNGALSSAITTPLSTAASYTDTVLSPYIRLGYRCYGDFTNNSGHCLVYVNGTQVLDYTDTMPTNTTSVNPFLLMCGVNAAGTPGSASALYVDYMLSASTKMR